MAERGKGLPGVIVRCVSRPANQELECSAMLEGSTMRKNGFNDEFFFVEEAKFRGIIICTEEWRESIGVEDVRCL